ncbi:MAG: GDP-L-fucose synthase [Xanthomonadales bacterium]|nr:GDP-L-fucose synthase [Xanthomonadales bacterium]
MNKPNTQELDRLRAGKIYVAGHRGMVGSALVRRLRESGCENLILKTRAEVDLENQQQVRDFMQAEKPDFVFLAAARVGGIHANNTWPAQFIYSNLMMAANVIDAAHKSGVGHLLFLGSSCIYPKQAPQPMPEACLLTGVLEETNEPYAIAKIAGIKLCESYNREYGTDYRSVMPTNLYGSNDNFDLKTSHVLPALLRKFHEAKVAGSPTVEIWGSGKPRREFLHVDDLADACLYIACLPQDVYAAHTQPRQTHLNIGTGCDVSIAELAVIIRKVVGYEGEIQYNSEYPDGTMRKLLDVSVVKELGWEAGIELEDGVADTYKWYLDNDS